MRTWHAPGKENAPFITSRSVNRYHCPRPHRRIAKSKGWPVFCGAKPGIAGVCFANRQPPKNNAILLRDRRSPPIDDADRRPSVGRFGGVGRPAPNVGRHATAAPHGLAGSMRTRSQGRPLSCSPLTARPARVAALPLSTDKPMAPGAPSEPEAPATAHPSGVSSSCCKRSASSLGNRGSQDASIKPTPIKSRRCVRSLSRNETSFICTSASRLSN